MDFFASWLFVSLIADKNKNLVSSQPRKQFLCSLFANRMCYTPHHMNLPWSYTAILYLLILQLNTDQTCHLIFTGQWLDSPAFPTTRHHGVFTHLRTAQFHTPCTYISGQRSVSYICGTLTTLQVLTRSRFSRFISFLLIVFNQWCFSSGHQE